MIWNDERLYMQCTAIGAELVSPFDSSLINPASIDLRLGDSYRTPVHANVAGWGPEQFIPSGCCLVLQPGDFVLCCTLETVHVPPEACAALFSKSSTGRMGLEHLHAGWIDPGFHGQLTLEFKNVAPWDITVKPGQRLMQLVVYSLNAPPARDYSQTGRYQGQRGATPARGQP